MKLGLPDNAREAFQFLALGIGSLLLLRIGYLMAEYWMAPAPDDALGQLIVPFKRGYLIAHPHALVPEQSNPVGRICRAALAGVAGAAATGLTVLGFQRALKIRSRAPWLAARVGFILCTLAAVWSAIAWPPRSMQLDAHGMLMNVRPEVWGLALPYPSERFELPFAGSSITRTMDARSEGSTIEIESTGRVFAIEPTGSDAEMDSLYSWLNAARARAH